MLDLGRGLDREEQAELGPAPSLRHGNEGLLTLQLFRCGQPWTTNNGPRSCLPNARQLPTMPPHAVLGAKATQVRMEDVAAAVATWER